MKKQTGAALIVSLVILVIMTIIGLASMRTSSMAEKMAANSTDVEIAFQSAEIALRSAESWIALLSTEREPNDSGSNNIWVADAMDPTDDNAESWWHELDAAWWTTNGIASPSDISFETNAGTTTVTTPRYIIEYQQFVTDDLVVGTGGGPSTGRVYYRITARGTGGSAQSRVMLQSTMAKRFLIMNKSVYLLHLISLYLLSPTIGLSDQLKLSNTPLYLGGSAEPNIMFILDDSGSMHYEVMPDEEFRSFDSATRFVYPRAKQVYGPDDYESGVATISSSSIHGIRARSPQINTIYYNPSVTYTPWVKADGTLFPPASPSSAYHNPIRINRGSRNLTENNNRTNPGAIGSSDFDSWRHCTGPNSRLCSSQTFFFSSDNNFWPATYYWFKGDDNSNKWNRANFDGPFEIKPNTNYSGHGRINRSDCINGVCSYTKEIQNFANWYTYYRSRVLTARAGIGKAFAKQSSGMRIGYATINNETSGVDGVSIGTVVTGVRPFIGDDRTSFFSNLYERTIPNSGTPLRQALYDVGHYFSSEDNRGPWGRIPGTNDRSPHLQCRNSYAIMMTDGYWSGTLSKAAATAVNNADNLNGVKISGSNKNYQYSPIAPFKDSYSETLADVAMHFWKNDLRPNLDNKVPITESDPSFWQNMVTFGVGLGVSGSIDPNTAFNAISKATNINWPDPNVSDPAKLDDLLHASVNSRGGFFSASDPDTFATELTNVLSAIQDREESSASSVALNSGSVSDDSRVFQALFDPRDWSGQLLSFGIETQAGPNIGKLKMPAMWDARNKIPTWDKRKIVTYNNASGKPHGKPFRYSSLNKAQQELLKNEETLNYLRGDRSKEIRNNGSFRNRNFLLGDIINSNPALVAAPIQRYPDNWGINAPENSKPYSKFKTDNKLRLPVVYVGANDGMLHAFNASSGAEIFSYVPNAVYEHLPLLTESNYAHRYYVDGTSTVVDAFDKVTNQWKSVLVSGLGAGGKGIFALDVTNPDVSMSDEGTIANKVLWEYTDKTDNNSTGMGYTFGQPSIVRLHHNNQWAALFSGGYNSASGNAILYLVDLFDGTFIAKFDTKKGTLADPLAKARPNGFATPAAVDIDGDSIIDYIYAGDLYGNIWKINVSDPDKNKWGFAFGTEATPAPLFTACFGNDCKGADKNKVQPITTRPQIVRHPTSKGFLVMFGTGKYFETDDSSATGQVTQSFYAIWDKAEATLPSIARSNLLKQNILSEVKVSGSDYRITSDSQIKWADKSGWFIDLISPGAASNLGERQVSNAVIRNGKVVFTTLLPSEDPCMDGGTSWLMELDFLSGARLQYSPFDINSDGNFDDVDYICIENCDIDADGNPDPNRIDVPVSGQKSNVGIISSPSIASEVGGQREFKYVSGSSGNIEVIIENPGPGFEGRQSWRQLDFQFR